MKKIYLTLIVALLAGLTTSYAHAQCLGRSCHGARFGVCRATATRVYSYDGAFEYGRACLGGCSGGNCYGAYATAGACATGACGFVATPYPCEAVTTAAPCEAVTLAPCAPVSEPAPCAQTREMLENEAAMDAYCETQDCTPCGSVATTATCTGEYCPTLQAVTVSSCPTGACPLRQVGKNVAQRVASLLDSANAVRARYRLPALTLDTNLESGSLYQAQYCASVGGLVHGSGVAEILAQNSQGLETALNQWLNSPAHRALLLNGSFRYAGVAVYHDGYGRVWCAMRFR